MTVQEGTPCWWELRVDDVPGTCHYYARRFGWAFTPPPNPDAYCIAHAGARETAAIGPKMFALTRTTEWATYLHTHNLDNTITRIRTAGGTILTPPITIGTLGRIAVFADPLGATAGLWEGHDVPGLNPDEHSVDTGIIGSRLNSPHPHTSDNFYAKIFGSPVPALPSTDPRSAWLPIFTDSQGTRHTDQGPEGETLHFEPNAE